MQYNFEWNPDKARENRSKHGVSFEEAATVFRDPKMLTLYDDEHSTAEERWVTLGVSSRGRILVVCHTYRDERSNSATIRLFSSRKARQHEIQHYQD